MEKPLGAQRLVRLCGKLENNTEGNGDSGGLACEVSDGSKILSTVHAIFFFIKNL